MFAKVSVCGPAKVHCKQVKDINESYTWSLLQEDAAVSKSTLTQLKPTQHCG